MTDKSLKKKAVKIKGKAYVLVADRVMYFNEQYPDGCITTSYTLDGDTYHFRAEATPDCAKPTRKFTGHSQATIGDGMVNKTAAMENAETSAVGRALAMMGIGVIESVASADEMNKAIGSNGTPNPATKKQIDAIYNMLARNYGLEQKDEMDAWLIEKVGSAPRDMTTKMAGAVMAKLIAKSKETETPEQTITAADENGEPITTEVY